MANALCVHVLAPGQPLYGEQEFDGLFITDRAYVVQVAQESDDASRLYVWSGSSTSKRTKQRAAKQASDLRETMRTRARVLQEQQGQESAEFKQLWSSVRYMDPSHQEVQIEEQSSSEQDEVAAEAALLSATPPSPAPKDGSKSAVTNAATPDAAADTAPAKFASTTKSPRPAAAAPAALPGTPNSPTKQASLKPPSTASAADAEKVKAVDDGVPEVLVPAPVRTQPGADEQSEKAFVEAGETGTKPKKLLTKRLPGSFVDPLHQSKVSSGTSTPTAAATTYLADAAKVWGAAVVADKAAAGGAVVEVKYIPLKDTFSYDELKAMRVESGIDMTRKEDYLSEEEFTKVFGRERGAFKTQPAWRQQLAKKQVGLF